MSVCKICDCLKKLWICFHFFGLLFVPILVMSKLMFMDLFGIQLIIVSKRFLFCRKIMHHFYIWAFPCFYCI